MEKTNLLAVLKIAGRRFLAAYVAVITKALSLVGLEKYSKPAMVILAISIISCVMQLVPGGRVAIELTVRLAATVVQLAFLAMVARWGLRFFKSCAKEAQEKAD